MKTASAPPRRRAKVALTVGAAVTVAIVVALFVLMSGRPVAWGVIASEANAIVVATPGVFSPCDTLSAHADERPASITITVKVAPGSCTQKVGHRFLPETIRLDGPIAGRAIEGPKRVRLSLSDVASTTPGSLPPMPRVIGFDPGDARAALRAAGVLDVQVVGTGRTVTGQRPAAGTTMAVVTDQADEPTKGSADVAAVLTLR